MLFTISKELLKLSQQKNGSFIPKTLIIVFCLQGSLFQGGPWPWPLVRVSQLTTDWAGPEGQPGPQTKSKGGLPFTLPLAEPDLRLSMSYHHLTVLQLWFSLNISVAHISVQQFSRWRRQRNLVSLSPLDVYCLQLTHLQQ